MDERSGRRSSARVGLTIAWLVVSLPAAALSILALLADAVPPRLEAASLEWFELVHFIVAAWNGVHESVLGTALGAIGLEPATGSLDRNVFLVCVVLCLQLVLARGSETTSAPDHAWTAASTAAFAIALSIVGALPLFLGGAEALPVDHRLWIGFALGAPLAALIVFGRHGYLIALVLSVGGMLGLEALRVIPFTSAWVDGVLASGG